MLFCLPHACVVGESSRELHVQSRAATFSRGLVKCFLRVPPALGQYLQLQCCPCKQGKLSKKILQNPRNKLPPQTVTELSFPRPHQHQHPRRHQDDSQHDDSARLRILAVGCCLHAPQRCRDADGLTEIIEPAAFARSLARCAMLNRIRSLPSLASPPRANEQHSLFTPQMAHTRLKGHVALHTRGLPYMTFK